MLHKTIFTNEIKFKLVNLFIILLLNNIILYSQNKAQINPIKIYKTVYCPTIDGILTDSVWAKSEPAPLKYWAGGVTNASPRNKEDISAEFSAAWSEQGLFVLMKIVDDIPVIQKKRWRLTAYRYDSMEIYLNTDWNNLRTIDGKYIKGRCAQIRINRGHNKSYSGENGNVFRHTIFKQNEVENGWFVEIYIPWKYFNFSMDELISSERTIGFEISVSDADDEDNFRDAILMWNNNTEEDKQWQNINYFGQIILSQKEVQ